MAPSYIARVEWRGTPPRETYDKLHALMSNLGFKQTIKGIHDETHIPVEADLPHATYAGVSDLEATRVYKISAVLRAPSLQVKYSKSRLSTG